VAEFVDREADIAALQERYDTDNPSLIAVGWSVRGTRALTGSTRWMHGSLAGWHGGKLRGTGFEPADPYGTAPSTLRR